MSELIFLSAIDMLGLFRSGQLSPVEVVSAMIAQIEEKDPSVNAIVERMWDEALRAARDSEDRYARGADIRPLEGIPVAAKAQQAIAGRKWTEGSLVYAERIAEHTHPLLERVLDSGGIIHARTASSEFCCVPFTHSRLWGITRNPWNLQLSPGGSSGGSSAALAAGMTTLATGSDTGGSIRSPAAFTGVVGLKPSYGRVPAMPPANLDTYCQDGPMGRSVGDCALLFNVISGSHPIDVVSLRPKLQLPNPFESVAGMTLALAVNLGDWTVDAEIVANTLAVGARLRDAGATVDEIEVGWTRTEVNAIADAHFGKYGASVIVDAAQAAEDLLSPYSLAFARRTQQASQSSLFDDFARESRIYSRAAELFNRYDALICPTIATTAFVAGEDYLTKPISVGGLQLESYSDVNMTRVFNILNRCPVLAVPSGWSTIGLPTGVQIAGRPYDEITVFRVGAAIEGGDRIVDFSTRRPNTARDPATPPA